MNILISLHNELNEKVKWTDSIKYGSIALGAYSVYSFAIKPFLSPLRKMPGPGYNPIYGNVRSVMTGEAMDTSVGLIKEYGEVVHFYHLFGNERVLIAGPKALKHVLVDNEKNYSRGGGGDRVTPITPQGIFTVTGDVHKSLRRLMNPFFNHESIKKYLSTYEKYGKKLVEYWKRQIQNSATISIQEDLKRVTLDIVCMSVFGYDAGNLEDPDAQFARSFEAIVNFTPVSFFNLLPFSQHLPTKENRLFKKSLAFVDQVIYGMIRKRREQIKSGKEYDKTDLLCHMMSAVDEETGKGLSDSCLHDQVFSLLLAGHETTSVTMSWLLLTVAKTPEVQDRIRQEALQFLPSNDLSISWDHLDKMKFSEAVVKEIQRLYPAAPSLPKRTKKDDTVCGYFIPAGTNVICHVGAMMRDPEVWKNPDDFNPDRFLENDLPQVPNPYTHLPFSTGPHKCLGHQFAKMQIRMLTAVIFKELSFAVPEDYQFKRKLAITLHPSPPVRLNVTPA